MDKWYDVDGKYKDGKIRGCYGSVLCVIEKGTQRTPRTTKYTTK